MSRPRIAGFRLGVYIFKDAEVVDPGVLRDIVRRFRGQLCLNAAATRAARGEIGHSIELIAT